MKKRGISLFAAIAVAIQIIVIPIQSLADDYLNVNFENSESISGWSNVGNVSFHTDTDVGNYMIADGGKAAEALMSPDFAAGDYYIVEWDMMIPTNKADGVTPNTIGGGQTGGIGFYGVGTVGGVIGYRGSGQGTPDHIISKGGSGNTYFNTTGGSKASASRDTWEHFTMIVDKTNSTAPFYVTDIKTGTVYPQLSVFNSFIQSITEITNIGIVSDKGYSIGIANLKISEATPDEMEISSDTDVQYISANGNSTIAFDTVQKKNIVYPKDGEIKNTATKIDLKPMGRTFSIKNYNPDNGVNINDDGVLTIAADAVEGTYTVIAQIGDVSAQKSVEILKAGNAASVRIEGDKKVISGKINTQYEFAAIPYSDNQIALPEKDTVWEIVGDTLGVSISEIEKKGVLSVPAETREGTVKIKATLVEENISNEFDVIIEKAKIKGGTIHGDLYVNVPSLTAYELNAFSQNETLISDGVVDYIWKAVNENGESIQGVNIENGVLTVDDVVKDGEIVAIRCENADDSTQYIEKQIRCVSPDSSYVRMSNDYDILTENMPEDITYSADSIKIIDDPLPQNLGDKALNLDSTSSQSRLSAILENSIKKRDVLVVEFDYMLRQAPETGTIFRILVNEENRDTSSKRASNLQVSATDFGGITGFVKDNWYNVQMIFSLEKQSYELRMIGVFSDDASVQTKTNETAFYSAGNVFDYGFLTMWTAQDGVVFNIDNLALYAYNPKLNSIDVVSSPEYASAPMSDKVVAGGFDQMGGSMEADITGVVEGYSGVEYDNASKRILVSDDAEGGTATIKFTEKTGITYNYNIPIAEKKLYDTYGVVLSDGSVSFTGQNANINGVIISKNKNEPSSGHILNLESYDGGGKINSAQIKIPNDMSQGVHILKVNDYSLKGVEYVKAYVKNSGGNIITTMAEEIKNGSYPNIPILSDWITNEQLGTHTQLGGALSPAGIDPDLVDTKKLGVTYTYDQNYPEITTDNMLWYKTGAHTGTSTIYERDSVDWEQQALPIGNGYVAGMLFSMPTKDHIQFNEETFWALGYRGNQGGDGSAWSEYVQRAKNGQGLDSGSIGKAAGINTQMGEGPNGYMNAGNIFVDFGMPRNPVINNYYRDLNLDEGVAHTQYEYNGVKYNREYFASYPDEVMVFRYTSDSPKALNFTVSPVSAHPGNITVSDGEITIIGKLKDSEPYGNGGKGYNAGESDLEYCTKVKIINNSNEGYLLDGYGNVSVVGATDVMVVVTAATDYDPNQFITKANGAANVADKQYKHTQGVRYAINKAEKRLSNIDGKTYNEIKETHINDYKNLFDRVKFSLTDDEEVCQIPTDELQKSYARTVTSTKVGESTKVTFDEDEYNKLDSHLEELHYNYARYMMISSSRETTMPANLQGKWCQSVSEIWGSCYCININLEMNYWMAGGANLYESGKALVNWLKSQIPAGRITAKNSYGITPKSDDPRDDLFIMHTKQSINGATDMTGNANIQSPGNTAWLMYNLWDLYMTTGDKEYLESDIYPIMRSCANFYSQYMNQFKMTTTDTEKYPNGYYYTTGPSRSPEIGPYGLGIKYDLQLVAGMYDYVIAAAKILGVDNDKVEEWKEIRNNMEAPVELGSDGQVKEWGDETTYGTGGVHRHISGLVGLYPGTLITRDTPEFLEGAKFVLEKRGDDATGWSCSNKFLLWSRALEGDRALELFRFQLAQYTYGNLFDVHGPFQIDGNFGSAAGVMELLLQSHTGTIDILPALPKAWGKGHIDGIRAKNGSEMSIAWEDGKASKVCITPVVEGDIVIRYDYQGNRGLSDNQDGTYTLKNAKAGVRYSITPTDVTEEEKYVVNKLIYSADKTKLEYVNLTKSDINLQNNGVLIAASYNGDTLINTKTVDLSEFPANEQNIFVDLNLENSKYVKVFIWDNVSSMKPILSVPFKDTL